MRTNTVMCPRAGGARPRPSRVALATALCALAVAGGSPAWAQAPGSGASGPAAVDESPAAAPAATAGGARELGGHVGVAGGGSGLTPGGLRVGGSYGYQLSAVDWFEGSVSFIAGGGGAGCMIEGRDTLLCDHGVASGRAAEISAGIRRFLTAQGQFTPYVVSRIGVRVIDFPGDDLGGVAVVGIVGAGVRARVSELVTVGGGAHLDAGLAVFGRDLGPEPQLGLTVHGGVEFLLR